MKNIVKIFSVSKPLHAVIVGLSLSILLQAVIQQAIPLTLKLIVDEITKQVAAGQGELNNLTQLLVIVFVVNVVYTLLSSVNQRVGDYLASRLGKFLMNLFYRKIFTLPQKYFDSEISGKIVNQLTRGIQSIREFVGAASNFILPALLQSVFTVAVLAYFNVTLGLLALGIFPVYIEISSYSTRKWGEKEGIKNKIEDVIRGRIQEVIGNIKLVKGFVTERKEFGLVSRKYSEIVRIYDGQSNVYHLVNFVREFALEITMMVIFIINFRQTFVGVFSLGEMVLILQLLNQLRRPLFAMSFILERIQKAEADSKAFFEIIELESVEKFEQESRQKLMENPVVRFDSVDFRYEKKKVLAGVSMSLGPSEKVALVGHSGAGKSTIVNLLCKFYDVSEGEIYLNDQPYSQLEHQYIRNHISLVFQDNELFSSTIRENVAYGVKVSDEEVIRALKQANAYEFVKKLPGGLAAEIGERGVKLSGGQKQRIQIARAILRDAPILILDEATSSLDSKSEKLVSEALERLMADKLVIIIAHRFSTIQNVDRVIVIDSGKIVDSGSSKELARKDGIYAELLRYQVEGNKKLLEQYEIY